MTPNLVIPPRLAERRDRRDLGRDLRWFYAYRLLATSYLFIPIFMLFQDQRGLSYAGRLALGGVFSATIVLAEVPTGVFADRFGRRRSMLLGALVMVVSCLVAASSHSFGGFAVAEVLAALSLALCSGADSAYLFDLLAAHDRGHEYGRRESVASAWHLLGSALAFAGGGLLATYDLALPYLATAFVAGAAAMVACMMRDDARHIARELPAHQSIVLATEDIPIASRPNAPSLRGALRAWGSQTLGALATVARNGRLVWLVGYSAVVFVLLRATIYIYQPYLHERGLGTIEIGVLFAGVYAVAAVVAFRTYHLRARFGDDMLLWALLAVLAVSFVGLAGAHSGPWMLALLLVQAVANGVYSPLTKPLMNREIADSQGRAAVLSVESMVRRAAMGLFAPLVGLYGQNDVMLLCGGVGLAGLALLALGRIRTGRDVAPVVPVTPDPR